MIAWEISFKKALLLSLIVHFIVFMALTRGFHARRINYWVATPVELVGVPGPAAPAPVASANHSEFKKEEIAKPVNKNKIVIKGKEKPKPKTKTKIKAKEPAPAPVSLAAPAMPDSKPVANTVNNTAGTVPGTGGQSTTVVPEVSDFPYLYYLNIIQKKVSGNWNFKYENPVHEKVVVSFKIARDGQVQDASVEKSSGIAYLDQTALRAVLLSDPFPKLPDDYEEESLLVHFGFEYKHED
jgi:TonB family protein